MFFFLNQYLFIFIIYFLQIKLNNAFDLIIIIPIDLRNVINIFKPEEKRIVAKKVKEKTRDFVSIQFSRA